MSYNEANATSQHMQARGSPNSTFYPIKLSEKKTSKRIHVEIQII